MITSANNRQMRDCADMGKVMEPTRRYDCGHYSVCLSDAARVNADEIECSGCKRYGPVPLRLENLRGYIQLLIAIFLPAAHQKISRCKIGDEAFWPVLFEKLE